MRVSTCFFNSSNPVSAWADRLFPSHRNGRVTIPTTSAPRLLAMFATNGAPPVPVPPPIPAVMNTISLPASARVSSSRSSSAARCPIDGSAPAPSPRVRFLPICILFGARFRSNACRSVLMAKKSTPCSPLSIMLFTALPPPPPTPTTRMRAPRSRPLSSSITGCSSFW